MKLTKLFAFIALFAFATTSTVSQAHSTHHHHDHHDNDNDFFLGVLFGALLASLTHDAADEEDDFNRLTVEELQDTLANEIILNDGEIESAEVLEIIDTARDMGAEGSDREIAENLLDATEKL